MLYRECELCWFAIRGYAVALRWQRDWGGQPGPPPRVAAPSPLTVSLVDRARRCPHWALGSSCCGGGSSCRLDPDEPRTVTIHGDCQHCEHLPPEPSP